MSTPGSPHKLGIYSSFYALKPEKQSSPYAKIRNLRVRADPPDCNAEFPVAVLGTESFPDTQKTRKHYLSLPEPGPGISGEEQTAYVQEQLRLTTNVLYVTLPPKPGGASSYSAAFIRSKLPKIAELLGEVYGLRALLVLQPEWFRILTRQSRTDATTGSVLLTPDLLPRLVCAYGPPEDTYARDREGFRRKAGLTARALNGWLTLGNYSVSEKHSCTGNIPLCLWEPDDSELEGALESLKRNSQISLDTETFSLRPETSGIASVAFAWSPHQGVAFPVDHWQPRISPDKKRRATLKVFLEQYLEAGGRIVYHNAAFDTSVLIRNLWMNHTTDQDGLLRGIRVLFGERGERFDCTKLLAYLSLNSTLRRSLELKDLARGFIPTEDQAFVKKLFENPQAEWPRADPGTVLRYNFDDARATMKLCCDLLPRVIRDEQQEVYKEILKPAMLDVVQMQLTGLPMDPAKVESAEASLRYELQGLLRFAEQHPLVEKLVRRLQDEAIIKKNNKLKKKKVTRADLGTTKDLTVAFNPASHLQMELLLFGEEFCGLESRRKTPTGKPAIDGDALRILRAAFSEDEKNVRPLLDALISYNAGATIRQTFLPHMINAHRHYDYENNRLSSWLTGNFNIGGTLSGRMSSSGPNLQNLPATAGEPEKKRLASGLKKCFRAPKGWLWVGMDFDSLEDRISALTTKDPEKIKVYTEGYDGHCLRAFEYFSHLMPNLRLAGPKDVPYTATDTTGRKYFALNALDNPVGPPCPKQCFFYQTDRKTFNRLVVNSIRDTYPELRQLSKAPTFTLTYQGTSKSLIVNCGFSPKEAVRIEESYHRLYKVSDRWVRERIEEAYETGYVTLAFGLRLRTPTLADSAVRSGRGLTTAARQEERTAGNALGQSWGLLNNRAASAFMQKVRAHPDYRWFVKPMAHIHDSQYYLVKNDLSVLKFFNDELMAEVGWQDHPLIRHPEIPITGTVCVYYPHWGSPVELPPAGSSLADISRVLRTHMSKPEFRRKA